jgi:glycosyltransferase involved in cell wall biosynthesis
MNFMTTEETTSRENGLSGDRMKMPVVSVILPTFNRSSTLGRAIKSVLVQSYKDFELIVVDDGSIDNTEDMVKTLMLCDSRIRYLRLQTNNGLCRARNTGIRAASGTYMAFQDSDDEWLQGKLSKQMEIMQELPDKVGIVYCFMYRVQRDGSKKIFNSIQFMPDDPDLYRKGLMYAFHGIPMQACLIRKSVFDKCGYFDEHLKVLEDTEFLMRTSENYDFFCITEPMANYYDSADGLTKNKSEFLKSSIYIFNKYYNDIKKDNLVLAAQHIRLNKQFKKVGLKWKAKKHKIKAFFFDLLGKLQIFIRQETNK